MNVKITVQRVNQLLQMQGKYVLDCEEEYKRNFCDSLLQTLCENNIKIGFSEFDEIYKEFILELFSWTQNKSSHETQALGAIPEFYPKEDGRSDELAIFCKNYISVYFADRDAVIVDPAQMDGRYIAEILRDVPHATGIAFIEHPIWRHILKCSSDRIEAINSRLEFLDSKTGNFAAIEEPFDIFLPIISNSIAEVTWMNEDGLAQLISMVNRFMRDDGIICLFCYGGEFQQNFEETKFKKFVDNGLAIKYVFGEPGDYFYHVVLGKTKDTSFYYAPSMGLITESVLRQIKNGQWRTNECEKIALTSWDEFASAKQYKNYEAIKKAVSKLSCKMFKGNQLIDKKYTYGSAGNNLNDEISNYIYLPRTQGLMNKIGIVDRIPDLSDCRLDSIKIKDLPYSEMEWYAFLKKHGLLSEQNNRFILDQEAFRKWTFPYDSLKDDSNRPVDIDPESLEYTREEPDSDKFWKWLRWSENILFVLSGSYYDERYEELTEQVYEKIIKRNNMMLDFESADPQAETMALEGFWKDMLNFGFIKIELNSEFIVSSYFFILWNGSLGQLYRENFLEKVNSWISVEDAFRKTSFFLPSIADQSRTVEETVRITSEINRLEEVKKHIVERPIGKNEFAINYSAIPYPLASILYMLECEPDKGKKVDILLHFFEATAMFHVVILLSGMVNYCQTEEYVERWKPQKPINWLKKDGELFQADFGLWLFALEQLGEIIKRELANIELSTDDNKWLRKLLIEAFGNLDLSLLKNILSKAYEDTMEEVSKIKCEIDSEAKANASIALANSLNKAREIRNAKSHGGYTTKSKINERYTNLFGELKNILPIIYKTYSDVDVIIGASDSAYKLAMGCHPQLRTIKYPPEERRKMSEVQSDTLSLKAKTSGNVLPLLPFVRMSKMAEDGEYLAAYFLHKFIIGSEKSEGAWIAYQCSSICEVSHIETETEFNRLPIGDILKRISALSGKRHNKK